MTTEWHEEVVEFEDAQQRVPLPILKMDAIGNVEATGLQLITVLQVDTSGRPDVMDLARVHALEGEGECTSVWGRPPDSDGVLWLILRFTKPARTVILLEFDIDSHGGPIDQIIQAQRLVIVATSPGNEFKGPDIVSAPKVVVEVPSDSFREEWTKLWQQVIVKKHGCTPRQAQEMQRAWRETMRIDQKENAPCLKR